MSGRSGVQLKAAQASPHAGAPNKILYVTPEIADFVKSGGLGDVSAALPRALGKLCDVRILIPGYRQVLRRAPNLQIVGHLAGLADIPACDIGKICLPDGLVVYALIAPGLYERGGRPYGNPQGLDWRDNDVVRTPGACRRRHRR